MKSAGIFKNLAKTKWLRVNGILREVNTRQPFCKRCKKPIEYVSIEDRGPDPKYPTWFEIRAVCHGKEDYQRVVCPTPMPPDMWSTVISTGNFFEEDLLAGADISVSERTE